MGLDIVHLTPNEYKLMPWKNGKGTTTEIAVWPRDAIIADGFDWRISLADLDGSGPFSLFPGYDRIIAQISGTDMVLKHKGKADKILKRFEPYSFAGEWETENILHGKAQDFNIMTKRGKYRAEAECLHIHNELLRREHSGGVSFLWLISGHIQLHESSKGHDHRLDPSHGLEIIGEKVSSLSLKARDKEAIAFFIRILPMQS